MKKSQEIICELFEADNSVSDPSKMMADLKIAYESNQWGRETLKSICDRHRTMTPPFDDAT